MIHQANKLSEPDSQTRSVVDSQFPRIYPLSVNEYSQTQLVILVHGLGAPRLAMSRLSWGLRKRGYRTLNWGYSSTLGRIASHADRFASCIHSMSNDETVSTVHLVTHSMGSILARVALTKHTFSKIGRVVMLAPPNHGSHAARRAAPMLGWLCAPLRELSDLPESFVNQLPDFQKLQKIELGIVEAKRDAVVSPESVRLKGQRDHAVVDCRHGLVPWHPRTLEFVSDFLDHGTFAPS